MHRDPLTDAARLARSWRAAGLRVLVHCVAAERRAPSVALAYAGAVGADVDEAAQRIRNLHAGVHARGVLWETALEVACRLQGARLSELDGTV